MKIDQIEKEEIIKRNKLDENILDLTIDIAFKKVFSDEKNKYYLAYLIWFCTGMDIEYIENHIKYKSNYVVGNSIDTKVGELDIIVEVDNCVLNIEMNKRLSETLIRKNKHYISLLNNKYTEKVKNNKFNSKYIIQINISTTPRIPKTNRLLYEIEYREKNLNISDVYNNEIIYDINLEYLKKYLYNKGKIKEKEKGLLLFIERNEKKLESLYRGDKKMEEVLQSATVNKYDNNDMFIWEYDREAFKEIVDMEWRQDTIKEANEIKAEAAEIKAEAAEIKTEAAEIIAEANEIKNEAKQIIEEAKKVKKDAQIKTIEMVRKMLENNEPLEKIISYTGLSKKEIKKIKQ